MRISHLIAGLTLLLSACGTAYISPSVSEADSAVGKVRVVPLTGESVLVANRSTYTPQSLPAAFSQTAGVGAGLRGAGAVPAPTIDQQTRPTQLGLRVPPAVPATPYQIGIGDVVLFATPSGGSTVEELAGLLAAQNRRQGYTVQDDGAIAIPEVGRIMIDGMTIDEAEAAIFQRLVGAQINPTFSLEIAEFNSQSVSVGGAVGQPAIVPITLRALTLSDALTVAGGIRTPDQDFATIRIYRDGALYQIPLQSYLTQAELQRIRLAAGDSVFVDTEYELARAQAYFREQITLANFRQQSRIQALNELNAAVSIRRAELEESRANFQTRLELESAGRDYVFLTGEVARQARFPLPFEGTASLADAIYSQGGFNTETGNPAQIYVLRGDTTPGGVTAWHLDGRNAVNIILATRMEMRPNDIVFISEQPITRWNRVVQQLTPSLITSTAAAITD